MAKPLAGQISTAFRKTGTSWRWALKGVGIFGIGVGVAVRIVLWKEPKRREGLAHRDLAALTYTLQRTVVHIAGMHSFWLLTLFSGLRTLSGVVFGYYMPGYLQQLYPERENIMSIYGLIVGVVGSVAALSGGAVTSLSWAKTKLTPLCLVSFGGVLSSVFVVIMVFSRDVAGGSAARGIRVLYGSMAAAYITAGLWLGPVNALLVLMFPPESKTLAFSFYTALGVLIYSSGPEIVGLALRGVSPSSDGYVRDVKVILAVTIPVGYVLSSAGFAVCLLLMKRDLRLVSDAGIDVRPKISARRKVALWSGFVVILIMVVVLFAVGLAYMG